MKRIALILAVLTLAVLMCACNKPAPAPSYGGNLSTTPSATKPASACLNGHDFTGDAANCLACGVDYFSATLQFKLTDDRNSYIVTGLGTCNRSEIHIPTTHKNKPVVEITSEAFSGVVNPICQTITKVTVPASVTKIGTNVFHKCLALTEVQLPEGLLSIGVDSFRECTSLENIRIPSTVTVIPERLFYLCSALKNVEIAGNIESIGTSAFHDCAMLSAIAIPDSVKNIGVSAFSGCASLQEIALPSGIESVGRQVVDNCTSLQYNVYKGMNYLGNDQEPYIILMSRADENQKVVDIHEDTRLMLPTALDNADITDLTISKNLVIPYNSLRNLPNLEHIHVAEGHPIYHTEGNCLIETATKTLVRGTANSVIPTDGSVTQIGLAAFASLQNLTSIVIPDAITVIGNGAFSGCVNLEDVIIGTGLTRIEFDSFSHCTKITVYFMGNFNQWSAIDIPVSAGGGSLSFGSNEDLLNAPRYYYSETEPESRQYYWHYVDGKPTPWETAE